MSYINTKPELKDYIFRRLGSEAHRVEVSDTNFDDIYNKVLNHVYEYTNDAVIRKTILVNDINDQQIYTLPDNVVAINGIYTGSQYFNTSVYYPGISPVYDFLRSGSAYNTTSYLIFVEQTREIRNLFRKKVNYDFNYESKKISLGEKLSDQLLFDIYEAEDETFLYESDIFLLSLERDCWRQWSVNTSKYRGSTIGQGVEINAEFMTEQANRLEDQIKESIENEEYDFISPRPIQ